MSASTSESTSTDLSEPSWVGELAQLQALRVDPTSATRLTLDQLKEKMHLAVDHNDSEAVKILSEVEQLQNSSIQFRRDVLERVGFGPLWSILSDPLNYRAVVALYPAQWLETSYGAPTAIFTEILAIADSEERSVDLRIEEFSQLLDAKSRVPKNATMLRAALDRAKSAAVAAAAAAPQA